MPFFYFSEKLKRNFVTLIMATVEGENSELSCPICLGKFNNPKKLPCLHTFCELCIQSYVQVQKTATEEENTGFFRCPLCRLETGFTNLSGIEWSQKLPNDYLITSLLDRISNDSKPKEIFCEPCKYANEKHVATYLCKDCKECMCDQCYNYSHKRKRDNNMHSVSSITPDTDMKPLEMDEPCPIHMNKVLEVFCFDHRKICCSICFAAQHRNCDNVKSLDDIAMNEEESIDVDDFVYKISLAEESTSTALNEANEKLTHFDDDKKLMMQSLADIIAKTKSHLDTLHEELKGSIEKTFSNTEQSQQFGIECMTAFQKMLIHSQKINEAVEEHGSEKQKFVTMETTKMAIEKHFERLRLAFNLSETSTHYVLDFEDNLKNVQSWSKLATLNSQQSDDPLADMNETLCSLGCFKDYTVFQHSFSLEHTIQICPPCLLPKSQSKWKIKCQLMNNNLSIYLNCVSNDNSDWPLGVSVELSLVNQVDRKNDIVRTFNHLFTKVGESRGYKSFIDLQSLKSTEKGYTSNGWFKIKVRLW